MKKILKYSVLAIAIIALTAQAGKSLVRYSLVMIMQTPLTFHGLVPRITLNDYERLLYAGNAVSRVAYYANHNVPRDKTILVFRRGKFLAYAKVKSMLFLNPKMEKVYASKTAEEGHRQLVALGISHIYVPPYYSPLISGTVINGILSDPRLSQRLFYCEGHSVFKILTGGDDNKQAEAKAKTVYAFSDDHGDPDDVSNRWTAVEGKKLIEVRGVPTLNLPFWAKGDKAIYTGLGPLSLAPEPTPNWPELRENTNYRISGELEGEGWVSVLAVSYWPNGLARLNTLIWDGTIPGSGKSKVDFSGVYTTGREETCIRLVFVLKTPGNLRVKKAVVSEIGPAGPSEIMESGKSGVNLLSWPVYPKGWRVFSRTEGKVIMGPYTQDFGELSALKPVAKDEQPRPAECRQRLKLQVQGSGLLQVNVTSGQDIRGQAKLVEESRYFFLTDLSKEIVFKLPQGTDASTLQVSLIPLDLRLAPVQVYDIHKTIIRVGKLSLQKACPSRGSGSDGRDLVWQTVRASDQNVKLYPSSDNSFGITADPSYSRQYQ